MNKFESQLNNRINHLYKALEKISADFKKLKSFNIHIKTIYLDNILQPIYEQKIQIDETVAKKYQNNIAISQKIMRYQRLREFIHEIQNNRVQDKIHAKETEPVDSSIYVFGIKIYPGNISLEKVDKLIPLEKYLSQKINLFHENTIRDHFQVTQNNHNL